MSLVVNLFAGPGAGKSTLSAYVFGGLKFAGINCELAPEFAKDLVWEDRLNTLSNQVYVFGKQYHRITRLANKVAVIICDSPLPLSVFYKPENLSDKFSEFVLEEFNKFNNLNFFIHRKKQYNPAGRVQTEEEARQVDVDMFKFLADNKILVTRVDGDEEGGKIIIRDILKYL
jgi:hypothetical protein